MPTILTAPLRSGRGGLDANACLILVSLVLAACSTALSENASKIRWASSPADVARCSYLGVVDGTSRQSGSANISTGRNNARNEALNRAAGKGATHVRWMTEDESWSGIHYTAEAYNCEHIAQNDESDELSPREGKGKGTTAKEDDDDQDDASSSLRKRVIPPSSEAVVPESEPTPLATGSCFFVSPDGIAVTNAHVIEGASSIVVVDAAGTQRPATVLRRSPDVDLVALDIPGATKHDALPIDAGASLQLGQSLFTIGFPYSSILGGDPKFADGSVAGLKGGGDPRVIQITIPIQPGNSGGPVVTESGVVIGVVVSKLDALKMAKYTGSVPENVSFAIKATELVALLRGVTLTTTKPSTTRADAVARAQAASCQVVTYSVGLELGTPSQGSDFDCETEGCPESHRCEVKSGLCRKR